MKLAQSIFTYGLEVWFDETTLTVGERLREAIDRGLAAAVTPPAVLIFRMTSGELERTLKSLPLYIQRAHGMPSCAEAP